MAITVPSVEWSVGEVALMAAAVSRAPSVHNTQPWFLETHGRTASLFERFDLSLPRHDRAGRDRMISCGAAVTNLRLAVRRLGWAATVAEFADPDRPDEVARVRAGERVAPTARELELFQAIARRRSCRGRFSGMPTKDEVSALVHANTTPGLNAHLVRDATEVRALAHRLVYAATTLQHDRAYLRELAAWTTEAGKSTSDGIPEANLPHGSLPWTGLVGPSTRIPDEDVLAERIAAETQLIVLTVGDGRSDHLHAGMALQEMWLAATAAGLAASVLTQPLHLHEVRAGLIEAMDLPGYPQAILRVGLPSGEVLPTPRRPLADVIRHRTKGTP
ncbi:Nitroreductase [Actinokineospora alba]|uniref:Nitroreductase n=1 Tax=Actinokineospora alba TaxID=504798 RepID=A0A1H0FP73_9PSEU|nr:nitroreductase family protein [Actinokineospora alba]TDP69559.1 nitroreductase [Actinokineospora alba]SDI14153.1 Nitroreductase [Actinokineospora alba]SDN96488.1 Nitroreductase [Actinokineospora alba]